MEHIKIVSFTAGGASLAKKMQALCKPALVECYTRGQDPSLKHTFLSRFAQQAMVDCSAIVFIGAMGIAIRAVAPYLQGKAYDPAIVVVDEKGQFVIPVLSGHLGGANALAEKLATKLNATAVLTTATDVNQVFAVDTWAKQQGLLVESTQGIQHVSAALLQGQVVGLHSDVPIQGALPKGIEISDKQEVGIVISHQVPVKRHPKWLYLIPKTLFIGMGCRRGKSFADLNAFVRKALQMYQIFPQSIAGFATVDIKKDEAGLLELSRAWNLPLVFFTKEELQTVEQTPSHSAFVEQTIGVDNVCERAAILASEGCLLYPKYAQDGMTIAIAQTKREVSFL